MHLTTLRAFARDNIVVLAQQGVWRSMEMGEVVGEATIASRFLLDGQHIIQFARYDTLDIALGEAGLHDADEISI